MGERMLSFLFIGRSPLLRRSDRRERIRSRARLEVVACEERFESGRIGAQNNYDFQNKRTF